MEKKAILIGVFLVLLIGVIGGFFIFSDDSENNITINTIDNILVDENVTLIDDNIVNYTNVLGNETTTNVTENTVSNGDDSENMQNTRIRLSFGDYQIIVNLNDSQASRDFVELLPTTIEFEDYNNTEKISTLQDSLNTESSPSGIDPEVGDFTYYIPWGNIAIFYRDFGYSNSLVKLGEIVEGLDNLERIEDGTPVRIEVID